jgi:cob(I)alamin adenosyltransferase
MSKGLLHLCVGDGKGKTSSAVGLAVRAAGNGCPVVFAQFLKDSPSGELTSLKALGIPVLRSQKRLGFTFQMDDKTKALCASEQRIILAAVKKALGNNGDKVGTVTVKDRPPQSANTGPQALVVLDEVLDALDLGFLSEEELRSFIEDLPGTIELVLTGCTAPSWLIDRADYHTEFRKLKHPYDQGISARPSIEF